MNRGRIAGCVAVVVLFLCASLSCFASQSEIDAIVAQVDAGFHQTFDGRSLRQWQETYQAACVKAIPQLAQLLQEDGTGLTHNPYQQHRDLLRRTLTGMQDKNMQAMDLYVQTSQKMLALPSDSAEASALRAQMSEQDKTVKVYDSIIATLRERLTYLDKCVPFAEKTFADAANARQAQAAQHPAPSPSSHPGALSDSGPSIAMPTGEPANIDYDPKKGLSIGCVATDAGCGDSNNVPPAPLSSSSPPVPPNRTPTADDDAALRQAAQQCKGRQQEAYERLKQKRRNRIENLRQQIPALEACIQGRREVPATNEQLIELHKQWASLLERAGRMEDQAAKNDAYRKWAEALAQATQLEQEKQQITCELRLHEIRNELANADKAMDELDRNIAAHRQKRFQEIDSLMLSRNLAALQRCAAQGYLELDDLMQELYK